MTESQTPTGPTDPESTRRDGPDRASWRAFGPYLSERQWGTVREDTAHDGNSWASFPHDQARSRAYHYGEDGIAGFSDEQARMCLALSLWNGHDPILKERMFGLVNDEGNHGEDAKEYWFYLDATPTSSYLKVLYKYPQAAFPYTRLVNENRGRDRQQPEFELLDTGIFDESRYFDVVVEYAKQSPTDIAMVVTAHNRGPQEAELHLLPTLWFRNTWFDDSTAARPSLALATDAELPQVSVHHPELGEWTLRFEHGAEPLFCDNETNSERLFDQPNVTHWPKDGINDHVISGAPSVNPAHSGTKFAAWHRLSIPAGGSARVSLRLTRNDTVPADPLGSIPELVARRREEADLFYAPRTAGLGPEHARIVRQALAGMQWGMQYFGYPVAQWIHRRGQQPFHDIDGRNGHWAHMLSSEVISMPDPWEYPWFAAWDLAFHAIPLAEVDFTLAKDQLEMLLTSRFIHPNGQIPAYEWDFDDVNPPVHAWASLVVYELEKSITGVADVDFLQRVFNQLLQNFTWWVNRTDPSGRNLFEGGFLGLDNIGVFDRSSALPTGGHLEQADATAWMAAYAMTMMRIALELAGHDPAYEPMVERFYEHFMLIATQSHGRDADDVVLWDRQDGFFYDALKLPDGQRIPLRVRSLVGLLSLNASSVIGRASLDAMPELREAMGSFTDRFRDFLPTAEYIRTTGAAGDELLALVRPDDLRRVLARMLDESEFLSPHGIRSLSRFHAEHPYTFFVGSTPYTVSYVPGDSTSPMFGGNSNWRGPLWFPANAMIVHALRTLYYFYRDDFTIDCPTGSGHEMTLDEVADEIERRMVGIFLPDENGDRPVNGGHPMWRDEHWRDLICFYEYFHGDDGHGLGASHQTGWTGLVAVFIDVLRRTGGLHRP